MDTDLFNTTAIEPRCSTCGQTTVGQSFWLNNRGPYCHACWAKMAALFPPVQPGYVTVPIFPSFNFEEMIRTELAKGLKPYLTRVETIAVAARALVAKLDLVSRSPEFTGVFQMAAIHGCPYTGPQFGPELEALRAALPGTIQSGDPETPGSGSKNPE